MNTPVALTIAGSDPSGGAGLQADLKTFHQFGIYGMSVVTLLTVQSTQKVSRVEMVDVGFIEEQIEAVLSDITPQAIKTGALGTAKVIECVADHLSKLEQPIVIDPVMISKHGQRLMEDSAIDAMKSLLLKNAFLVTPNVFEAQLLSGVTIADQASYIAAAETIAGLGPKNVLIKGRVDQSGSMIDVLWMGKEFDFYRAPEIQTQSTHGTGCVLSAAITASLAAGLDLRTAVQKAKLFITNALDSPFRLGKGIGPINMHTRVD